MRIQLFTKRPTAGGYQLVYRGDTELDDLANVNQVLSSAFQECPNDILDNIIEIRVQGDIGDWRTIDLPSMRWNEDENLHLCRGCGGILSHLDTIHCSDVCRIRDAHQS